MAAESVKSTLLQYKVNNWHILNQVLMKKGEDDTVVVIFDIIIIRIFDDSSVCSFFFSWFKFRYVWVWESRLTDICVNRFLSVITFLMGLLTEVSSSLGFNWVWLSGFKWVRFGTIADLAYYLNQSSCFGLKYGLVELAVELSLVFLWDYLFHFC